jgi:hypothetical protein
MMNLNLNFLPQKNRRDIITMSWLGLALNVLRSTIFAFIIFDAFLTLLWLAIDEQNAVLTRQSNESVGNSAFYGQEIEYINKKISAMSQAGGDFGVLTPRFYEVIDNLPSDIKLKSLNVGLDQSTSMTLSGTAKTRDALIAYAEDLKEISWVETVVLPKSLLLQKENIDFNLDIALKPISATK